VIVPALFVGAVGAVEAAPVAAFTAAISPKAKSSRNHIAGTTSGALARYADLNAVLWYIGGSSGRDARGNRRGARALQGMRGIEDSLERIKK
jgi:hypothetical protein